MISDEQLAALVNGLGAVVFVLIAAYHYVSVNHPSLPKSTQAHKHQQSLSKIVR